MTKLFNLDDVAKDEKQNLESNKLSTIKVANFNSDDIGVDTIRLAKSLEDLDEISDQNSSDDTNEDDLVEILSATLKKKIEIETRPNKEIEDDDVSNVRETMLSFLQDSSIILFFNLNNCILTYFFKLYYR